MLLVDWWSQIGFDQFQVRKLLRMSRSKPATRGRQLPLQNKFSKTCLLVRYNNKLQLFPPKISVDCSSATSHSIGMVNFKYWEQVTNERKTLTHQIFRGKCIMLSNDRLASHMCNYKLNLTFRRQVAITVETTRTCLVRNAHNWNRKQPQNYPLCHN